MSTLKVDGIRSNSATSDAITLASDGTCTANVTNNLSNRNLIINGAMQVAQRGTTSTSTDGYLHVDRFRVSCGTTGNSITTSQSTDSPVNFKNSLKYTVTSAAGSTQNSSVFEQMVEGQDMSHLNWGTSDARAVVLSFYVKCSVANLVLGGAITNNFNGQTYPFTYTTNSSANTWTRHTVYIAGPTSGTWATDNGIGMRVIFNLGSASARLATAGSWANTVARGPTGAGSLTTVANSTFFLTGVQLEIDQGSSVATDFEHRSFAQELALCQRYYFVYMPSGRNNANLGMGGYTGGGNQFELGIRFPKPMRTAPSLEQSTGTNYFSVFLNNTTQNFNSFTADQLQPESTGIFTTDAGSHGGKVGRARMNNASASIAFNAEL